MFQHKVVDLTTASKPSNFQPHSGAKRLVIKNLRTTQKKDVDSYYKRTWEDLDAAVTSVFNGKQPCSPLEVLCRGVEATCRHGQAERLSVHLKDRCKRYLEKDLLPVIEAEAGATYLGALRTVYKYWTIWNNQAVSFPMMFASWFYTLTFHE